jgi:hypothetical protein
MAKRGPKTQAGRAAASRNSLKHGLTSEANVIPGMESEEEWEAHRKGVFESLNPEGHFQEILAGRIANLTWRFNRINRHEVAITVRNIESSAYQLAIADAYGAAISGEEAPEDVDPDNLANLQETRVVPEQRHLEQIMRYETHLHRQWVQTLHELEALQQRRKGLPTHLARLDISGSPAN